MSIKTVASLVLAALSLLSATSPSLATIRLLESSSERVLLEIALEEPSVETISSGGLTSYRIRFPNLSLRSEPGLPEVPVGGILLAVPPHATASLHIVREDWSNRRAGPVTLAAAPRPASTDFHPDLDEVAQSPRYDSIELFPKAAFELSATKTIRTRSVVELRYHPVRVLNDEYQVLRSAVVEVRFRGGSTKTFTPGAQTREERWDSTYRSTILNAEAADDWIRSRTSDASAVGDSPWGGGVQWRVRTGDTGIVELPFSTLSASEFPNSIPVTQVSLYQRRFDVDRVDDLNTSASDLFLEEAVPGIVRDRNSNDVFDEGDGILFYARSFRDEYFTSGFEHEDKFDDQNFLWVRIDPTGGARMETERPEGSLSGAPATPLESTPHTIHVEEDRRYYRFPPDHGAGQSSFETEIYYWNGPQSLTTPDAVVYPGYQISRDFEAPDLVPGSAGRLVARVVPGGFAAHGRFTNELTHQVNATEVGSDTFYNAAEYSLSPSVFSPAERALRTHTIPGGVLRAGSNRYDFTGWSYVGSNTATNNNETRFFFDWFEIEYERRLVVRDGQLLLDTSLGANENLSLEVTGLEDADVALFNVTDPDSPRSVGVSSGQVVPNGGEFQLTFDTTTRPVSPPTKSCR